MAQKKASQQHGENLKALDFNGLTSHFHVQSKRLTEKQKQFLEIALDSKTNIIFCAGPAGTTKTYVAVYSALRYLSANVDLDFLNTFLQTVPRKSRVQEGGRRGERGREGCRGGDFKKFLR